MPAGVTLQVNLCAGDAAYAEHTVPPLVRAHPGIGHRLLVVDCCRPQRTRIFDPATRLPEPAFTQRLDRVRRLAAEFQRQGLFDEIAWLEPGSALFPRLAARYARPWMVETHDYGGCAFMGYWAALDLPATRFVLHYDADMLIHSDTGFDWTSEALKYWETHPQAVAACPRISPPGFAREAQADAPSLHEGRPAAPVAGGWLNDWFSTRCLLLDRARLAAHLPLVRGPQAVALFLRRWLDRGYPPGPEHLLHRALGVRGRRCLQLSSESTWLLHPARKTPDYLEILPRILACVARGEVPPAQRGHADIRLEDWQAMLGQPAT